MSCPHNAFRKFTFAIDPVRSLRSPGRFLEFIIWIYPYLDLPGPLVLAGELAHGEGVALPPALPLLVGHPARQDDRPAGVDLCVHRLVDPVLPAVHVYRRMYGQHTRQRKLHCRFWLNETWVFFNPSITCHNVVVDIIHCTANFSSSQIVLQC